MTTPQDPRKDTFQDDEAALAKVLRALPGGEPSPRVDAAILAAARDATSGSGRPRHRRRGLPGWALGTAAAAVLAVGIGLQLDLGRDALPDGMPAEAPLETMAKGSEPEQPEVTGSRLKRTQTQAPDESEAPPVLAKPASPAEALQTPSAPAAMAPPAPPPPPAPGRVLADSPREERAAAETASAQAQSPESTTGSGARAPAQALERRARLAPEPVAESAPMSDAATEAGALPSAFSADDVLPPVDEDARLDAQAWLERIRDRIRQGDRAGAGASLRRFEREHPDLPLPPDLVAFRP